MRHGKKINHLGRKTAHRKAMLSNMACSLIEHKRINTTVAKAKALRVFVEPLITKSKEGDNASMAMIEFVDYNEIYNPKGAKAKKTTRRGRSKKAAAPQVETTTTEEKSEE